MKKSLLVVMSVAILGGLGLYINKGDSKTAMADTSAVSPASTANTQTGTQAQQNSIADNSAANSSSSSTTTNTTNSASGYKDGIYTGSSADTLYGTVEIAAVISGGKITDIKFLQMPNDQEHSQEVTAAAEPLLKQETIKAQSAHIDFVSGATQTSQGYKQSLQAALDKALS